MHPAHLKAKQAAAMAGTAAGLAEQSARLAAIEAALAEVLAILKAAPDAATPKPPRKDK